MIKLIKKFLIKPYLKNREYRKEIAILKMMLESDKNYHENKIMSMVDEFVRILDKNKILDSSLVKALQKCSKLKSDLDIANKLLQEK